MQAEQIQPETQVDEDFVYVGFWLRVWASVIDSVLVMAVVLPILLAVYGEEYFEFRMAIKGPLDFLMMRVLPAVAVIIFWFYRSATPGKMSLGARIVDARTGTAPSKGKFVIRYLGYYVSLFGLGLGFLWIAFDARKQGWHDKIAGTVVVRPTKNGGRRATFEG